MTLRSFFGSALLLLALTIPAGAQDLEGTVEVDPRAGTATYTIDLGSFPRAFGFFYFGIYQAPTVIFPPGPQFFMGLPIDLNGTEGIWQSANINGLYFIPVIPNSIQDIFGTGKLFSPHGDMNSFSKRRAVQLGPAFSQSNFDIPFSSSFQSVETMYWNSSAVPNLNGAVVTVESNEQVTNVDAANRIVDTAVDGVVRALPFVETFTITATVNVNMPGTVIGDDIQFLGNANITSLDFAPGSIAFQGQPVDFDGTEASFLATSYSGGQAFPAVQGLPVQSFGGISINGPVGTMFGSCLGTGFTLGPSFSASQFDIFPGSTFDYQMKVPNWSSPVIPELNGAGVGIAGINEIIAIDPILGIVDVQGQGSVFGNANMPGVSPWGMALLLLGLAGMTVLWMRRPVRA